jgi:16S rRNA (cytosine967-C5)-methyltransferase
MQESIVEAAANIIQRADHHKTADAALRAGLRAQRGLSPEQSRQIVSYVFAYYRWFGWLDSRAPLHEQILLALALAKRFAEKPSSFSDAELLQHAIPEWTKDFLGTTAAWVRSLQREPEIWLRARPGQGSKLSKKLGDCIPAGTGCLNDALRYCGTVDLFSTREFHAGEFELQDISSQAVGWICDPKAGETWWDACAGEGGKTLHIADLMENKGLVWASDRAEWRLKILKRRAARAKIFNYRSTTWDGGPKPPVKTSFDGALVDAPCSGLGTWQRNPHARWTATPRDIAELSAIQLDLLKNVSGSLKKGGRLLYAVCTLTRPETTEIFTKFTQQSSEFEPLPVANPFDPKAVTNPQHWFWPQDHGGNGMFVAAWRRK